MSYLRALLNSSRVQKTAVTVNFRKMLATADQNRIIQHPIAPSKNDLTRLQRDNLIPACTYTGAI